MTRFDTFARGATGAERKRVPWLLGCAWCVCTAALASAQGELRWSIENLSGSPGRNSTAHSINDQGFIAGRADNKATGWFGGQPFTFAPPSGSLASDAWDVNELGLAVGQHLDGATGNQVVTLWRLDASFVVGALPGGADSFAHAVNDQHFFVGSSTTSGHTTFHAFVGYFNLMLDLHRLVPWAGRESHAWDINDAGQIVGEVTDTDLLTHAVVWHPTGEVEDLGSLGGSNSAARGVNEAGDVVGGSETASGELHAFLSVAAPGSKTGRVLMDLGNLPGGSMAEGLDVNASREMVGWAHLSTPAGATFVAIYWSEGTGMIDLNALIAHPDWHLEQAEGINDRGDIVGYGWHAPTGDYRGFLLRRQVEGAAAVTHVVAPAQTRAVVPQTQGVAAELGAR